MLSRQVPPLCIPRWTRCLRFQTRILRSVADEGDFRIPHMAICDGREQGVVERGR